MSTTLELYLFGDQTFENQPHLSDLLSHRNNLILNEFFDQSYEVVRKGVDRLPLQVKSQFPRFACIEDVFNYKPEGKCSVIFDTTLVCIYQLGLFIHEQNSFHLCRDKTRVLGLCTGALAAAAVSCSQDVAQLLPFAIDAVAVAFKVGVLVSDIAQKIDISEDAHIDQSWSMAVSGAAVSEAVNEFCEMSGLPVTAQPWISAYATNGITVSGRPCILELLRRSEAFQAKTTKSLKIFGPYHAQHLSSKAEKHSIVASLSQSTRHKVSSIPVFSGTGQVVVEGSTFEAVVEHAIEQIIHAPIYWEPVLNALQTWLHGAQEQETGPQPFQIHAVGSNADHIIYRFLKQQPALNLQFKQRYQDDSSEIPRAPTESVNPRRPKLAIIGYSGRYPGAGNNQAFWELLSQGLDVHSVVPSLRWDAKAHVDRTGKAKNTSCTPFGCWLENAAEFDAKFFHISPREAAQVDPAQRIALMTAYEAIEQAGIVPDATPSTRRDRVGVFYGVTSNDWMETNSAQNIDTYFIPGGNRAFIPGRINYFFKFSGPSYAIDTACSSSLSAIHIACNSLWQGDIDTAITGGTNVLTNPDFTAGLDRGHFLSRSGNCKTFDDSADGYCRGEGVATVIIKRLDDAIADNDPIKAVILGAYTNHSAESPSITRPHIGAQHAILNKILLQSGVHPYAVSYVEMHGTGTQEGDAAEMSSVLQTLAPSPTPMSKSRAADQSLYLGALKSNIGHGEAASGVCALIKVLLMLEKNSLAPHCGIKTRINHKFPTDLAERNVHIPTKRAEWKQANGQPRRAFVNNFSAAGGNSALLIEDPPLAPYASDDEDFRTSHLVAISAKSATSLQGNLRSILQFLIENPSISIPQLSYTTTARRLHHRQRIMLSGNTVDELRHQIQVECQKSAAGNKSGSMPKLMFTFTGNGAQYPGMGKEMCETSSFFRTELGRLDYLGQSLGFPSIMDVIQSNERHIDDFPSTCVQLATLCLQIALSKLWESWGVTPDAVVGHSLGEFSALCVAGVLSDVDVIYLVGKRAQLLEDNCTRNSHSMLVVKSSVKDVTDMLRGKKYEIACANSDIETVIAGRADDIIECQSTIEQAGGKTHLLKVPYAFHSAQVDPILPGLGKAAQQVTFRQPKIPVLRPLDGVISITAADFTPEYIVRHCRETVNMTSLLSSTRFEGPLTNLSLAVEIGPHPAVSGMITASRPDLTTITSLQRGRSAWHTLTKAVKALYLQGAELRWLEYHRDFKSAHKVIRIPAYNWDLAEYWMQYKHDWSLRKGDPPTVADAPKHDSALKTTTVHEILEELNEENQLSMIVQSNISRSDLSPLVQGHEVDGVPLCTPSVYCDIALTLGKYMLDKYRPGSDETQVVVSDMNIKKALILNSEGKSQLLQAHVQMKWTRSEATLRFVTFTSDHTPQEHATCVVHFTNNELRRHLERSVPSVVQKMQALSDSKVSGATTRFDRRMVYRMIRPLANFHSDYRAIDEVILNNATLEACSRVSFKSVKMDGSYHTHPAIIDALTQSCGFTMNCNDQTDLDSSVYMNHGWLSLQIFEPIDPQKSYRTYSQMHEGKDNLWYGDVVILDEMNVVAHFKQIVLQCVPRRLLRAILSQESQNKRKIQSTGARVEYEQGSSSSSLKRRSGEGETSKSTSNAKRLFSIVAEESGVPTAELVDNVLLADLGVDSLMSLTLCARLKEELGIDVDFSTILSDYPSMKDLMTLLGGDYPTDRDAKAMATRSQEKIIDSEMSTSSADSLPIDKESVASGEMPDLNFAAMLTIFADEVGVPVSELTDSTLLSDCGVDSLMSLLVTSRFQEELGLDIEEQSFLLECETIADMKRKLYGQSNCTNMAPDPIEKKSPARAVAIPINDLRDSEQQADKHVLESCNDSSDLEKRKAAVDRLVSEYTQGFKPPGFGSNIATAQKRGNVVLITGATGSLGCHLTYHLAQLDSISTVYCLNREHRTNAHTRQLQAMRDKGIRFPAGLEHKICVIQTDTSKPLLGLDEAQYMELAENTTHMIHNAWPMSAKRPLEGFETQFQIMRNLIDFAGVAVSRRPEASRLSFEFVSSIGVVGRYGLGTQERVDVLEQAVGIDSVLQNGYGEAKWGCERMLGETLHRYPSRFRTMITRLGQIAGSKTSGYWNPMEHFGFIVKSAQTLQALPDLDGNLHWTPVNDVAAALCDLVLADNEPYSFYHIENQHGQSWKQMTRVLSAALNIPSTNLLPFQQWLELVKKSPQQNNPASTLLGFLDDNFLRLSCGGLVLNTDHGVEHSHTLAHLSPIDETFIRKCIHIWREIGFLKSSEEERTRMAEERKWLWRPSAGDE